ncbi:type II toxin-antitoxin system RnlB family antitoxin [Pedobacter sp. Leaf170]|uniref:type II toxin-antitoxin system RnlB family antitoxin n=1 Tax=Pedobacter sp. Leaf170 TaxID=2876558 RepID=UPI001E622290|nr:type II toxin-antitoxin system RnlB family antitoxin [Pedobacter sp. Leaf170]
MRKIKTYDIVNFDNSFLHVIANSTVMLSELISDLNRQIITKTNFQGTIVLDMLIVNGNSKKRFFQSFADNDCIKLKDVEVMYNVPSEILNISTDYIKNHLHILNQGILTKIEIEKIKQAIN